MEKTKVEITGKFNETSLEVGDKGYIDGYVRMATGVSFAVVVTFDKIDICPFWAMKPQCEY